MTPHISGTSLSAQARYAAGTREVLECFFEGRPIRDEYLIVDGGHLAGAGAHSYSPGQCHDRLGRCGALLDSPRPGPRTALGCDLPGAAFSNAGFRYRRRRPL